jgi:outer membrane protein assembly factor BamB
MMKTFRINAWIRLIPVSCLGVSAIAETENWNGFRGPDRTGVSSESDWVVWDDDSPKIEWTAEVGKGFSTVVPFEGRVYTMGNTSDTDTVFCLDAETGREIWTFSYDCIANRKAFFGPRSTPAVDYNHVYTMSWTGQIHCLDVRTGEPVWVKTNKDYGIEGRFGYEFPNWGLSGSPLVHGDLVYFDAGTFFAVNRKTGEKKWELDGLHSAYSSPMIFEDESGRSRLATLTTQGLVVADAGDGTVLSRYPWTTMGDANCVVPIVRDDTLFISSGWKVGAALLRPSELEAELLWKNTNMANALNSCVLIDDHLYGFNGQVSDYGGEIRCMKLSSGELTWKHEGLGVGSLIAAGGRLIVLSESGELVIADADPTSFRIRARAQVLENTCWTAPTISKGLIYCRDMGGKVVCINARKESPPPGDEE